MKTLQLRYFNGETAEVLAVSWMGMQATEESIGHVSLNRNGLWSARSLSNDNHGDRYTTKWNAAKQLALGLGKGEYVR